jgi:hypothetical protein
MRVDLVSRALVALNLLTSAGYAFRSMACSPCSFAAANRLGMETQHLSFLILSGSGKTKSAIFLHSRFYHVEVTDGL